jgi:hypothetical protein
LAAAKRITAIRSPLFSGDERETIICLLIITPIRTINENIIVTKTLNAISGLNLIAESISNRDKAITLCVPPHVRQGIPVITRKRQGGIKFKKPPRNLAQVIIRKPIIPQMT